MKVLITGGAGFIGSHLAKKLLDDGKDVVVLDNLSNGENILKRKNYKLIKGDITNPKIFSRLPKDITTVYHLAALIDARESVKKPDLYFNVDVAGTLNVLEFCRKRDIEKIVFTSSAAVYGNYNRPVKETDKCEPLTPYGRYKLISEELIRDYHKFYGINYSIFRLFNVYGPGARSGVIKNLIEAASKGKVFSLYGDGYQKRDFIFIDDVVKILSQHKKAKNTTINVGTGIPTSVLELIEVFNSKNQIKINRLPEQNGDIYISVADIYKLKMHFPSLKLTSLREGLEIILKPKIP